MEIDISTFMEKGDDGSVTKFDESKLASYIDSLVSKGVTTGVENYKAKTAKEAEMAKMTEEQKNAEKIKEFEQKQLEWEKSMIARERELVVKQAKTKLSTVFSEKEIELLLKNVSNDEKESMEYVDGLVAERTKFIEENRKKLIEELQSKQPQTSTTTNTDDGKTQKPVKKTSQEILDLYK